MEIKHIVRSLNTLINSNWSILNLNVSLDAKDRYLSYCFAETRDCDEQLSGVHACDSSSLLEDTLMVGIALRGASMLHQPPAKGKTTLW